MNFIKFLKEDIKPLNNYINENYADEILKLSVKDKEKLINLDLEFGKVMLIARYETVVREITNKDEEWERFQKNYVKRGVKYFPVIKYKPLKHDEYDLETRIKTLIGEFEKLNCFVTKYYVDILSEKLENINYFKTLDDDNFVPTPTKLNLNFPQELIDKALKILKDQPYEKPTEEKYVKHIPAEDVKKDIEKALKDLGYDWEIVMKPNMMPRMGVNPEKTFRMKPSAKFSEVDIDNLIAHEIKGHVARRYWGYQNGLFLFVFGLPGRNTFDEGMAIWNTLNITKEPKKNAMFKLALSYMACYYCLTCDFCEAYDKLMELLKGTKYPPEAVFSQLLRCKRVVVRTDRLGCWPGDIDYFRGYELVSKMNKSEREDIIKYNIGPNQFYELDAIKKFISVNKFSPISDEKLKEVRDSYTGLSEEEH